MLDKQLRMEALGPAARVDRSVVARASEKARHAAPAPSATAGHAVPQSEVLAMAAAIASQSPPIDTARVAALKEVIASGDYPINVAATALAIANALVDTPGS